MTAPPTPRGPGRPRVRHEPLQRLNIDLPQSLAQALDAITDNKRAYVERALREQMARDQEEHERP